MDNIIEIQKLNCTIGSNKILHDINLHVRQGEFVGLIGPNGAGKTTLLKCINGIYPAEGQVKIKDVNIKTYGNKELAREVALMHQNTSIDFPFSALDIVLMGRYPHLGRFQRESGEDRRIARSNMSYTNIQGLENSPITQMSGGERQRVLFAKTLTQQSGIVLLDEPTASLDITYQEQIFKYSAELTALGITVIAAIHDLKIAARYCTRLVLLEEGTIAADGKPEYVLTSENISKVYGVNALVYRNRITGLLDIYINRSDSQKKSGPAHVIGGGGSATAVLRALYEQGYTVTAGVFSHGDSDIVSAEVFGMKYLEEKPFSEISAELQRENIHLIENSELTILCSMPFGFQNIGNLQAAKSAKKLVIIEDERPEVRDYTEGRAVDLYNGLKRTAAAVIPSARIHEVL